LPRAAVEAIVRSTLRPSFYMSRDRILSAREGLSDIARQLMEGMDLDFDDRDLFEAQRMLVETRAMAAGRLNLFNGFREYAGTGWLVDDGIAVTNRHVAELFARRWMGEDWEFQEGQFDRRIEVRLNPLEQIDTPEDPTRAAFVTGILWVAGSGEPDMAFLKVHAPGAEPVPLAADLPGAETPISVIGYPERDPRDNPRHLIVSFFGDRFGVKRCAPGRVMRADAWMLEHDASTLGGNSGSVVIATETGEAVGLHFAGAAQERNVAVPSGTVAAALRRLKSQIAMPALGGVAADAEIETSRADFADREGFDRAFLGGETALPGLGSWQGDLAPVAGGGTELRYVHFSVWQSASRKLPLLTAVNIDGARLRRVPRRGTWRLDGRLDRAHQAGNELYRSNPLDKGHMVRRLDPCWAEDINDEATILKAQADTFHYTNSAPQHEQLNQRDRVGLEGYILDASEEYGFKVSVLTGPVFRDDDRRLKNQPGAEDIAIPRESWKVAVMRRADDGALSATGYVLSHGEIIKGLTEAEFVLGAYETCQVPLALIEGATGLDFGMLKEADPLHVADMHEAAFGRQALRVRGPGDLTLARQGESRSFEFTRPTPTSCCRMFFCAKPAPTFAQHALRLADRETHVVLGLRPACKAQQEQAGFVDGGRMHGQPVDPRPVIGKRRLAKAALDDPALVIHPVEDEAPLDRGRGRLIGLARRWQDRQRDLDRLAHRLHRLVDAERDGHMRRLAARQFHRRTGISPEQPEEDTLERHALEHGGMFVDHQLPLADPGQRAVDRHRAVAAIGGLRHHRLAMVGLRRIAQRHVQARHRLVAHTREVEIAHMAGLVALPQHVMQRAGALDQRGHHADPGRHRRVVGVERGQIGTGRVPDRLFSRRRDQLIARGVFRVRRQPGEIAALDPHRAVHPEDARQRERRAEMGRGQRNEQRDLGEPRLGLEPPAFEKQPAQKPAHRMADQRDFLSTLVMQRLQPGGHDIDRLEQVAPPVIGKIDIAFLRPARRIAHPRQQVAHRRVEPETQDVVDQFRGQDRVILQLVDALVAELGFQRRRRPDLLGAKREPCRHDAGNKKGDFHGPSPPIGYMQGHERPRGLRTGKNRSLVPETVRTTVWSMRRLRQPRNDGAQPPPVDKPRADTSLRRRALREETGMADGTQNATAARRSVVVQGFTNSMLDPDAPMPGPVEDGGTIIANTAPGCWGPMIAPSLRGGHEVTQPVAVAGRRAGRRGRDPDPGHHGNIHRHCLGP